MAGVFKRLISGAFLLRSVVKELRGIREQLTRQTDLLEEWSLKMGVVPASVIAANATDQALDDSGVSFVDAVEQQIAAEYVQRVQTENGRQPTDEEILRYLADEKTLDLHARLTERQGLLDLEALGKLNTSGRGSRP